MTPSAGIPTGEDPSGTAAPDFDFEALHLQGVDDGGRGELLGPTGTAARSSSTSSVRGARPVSRRCLTCEAVSQELIDDVVFLGLAENDTREDALEIVERTGVTYDIGNDPGGDILASYEGLAMPTTVFIAADGTITSLHSGALTAEDLRSRIEAELL